MVLELQLMLMPYVHTLTSHSLIFNLLYSGNDCVPCVFLIQALLSFGRTVLMF